MSANKVILPSWEDIQESNQPFVDSNQYKGYMFKENLSDNLFVLIDCQNESVIYPHMSNVIRFALCTNNEFAISSVRYENTEAGYLLGCAHLVESANRMAKALESFSQDNVFSVQRSIDIYNQTYTQEGEPEYDEK